MDENIKPAKFCDTMEAMSKALVYFPRDMERREEPYEPLSQDDLIDICDKAKKPRWNVHMARQNINILE